jgi:hypothetical protein
MGIPPNTIDDLFLADATSADRPILLKCDIEGAELLMLRGARRFLERCSPQLLLSVHPSALPQYKHTSEDVGQFLAEVGYEVDLLAIDHEEHWWCSRR